MEKKHFGIFGEGIAENYLRKKGYQILDRNYSIRTPFGPQRGEIDIIAKKGDTITFIEVKTLRGRVALINPEEKVDYLKKRKILKTAESWLMEKKIPIDSKWQIDIISIRVDPVLKKAKIRHFQNAIS
jgi:putative endonuclease